ncbi:putative membrane protein [Streptococcus intermedius BA1]|uniref:DUF6773 family protein n=1 Tax=Streptococcus intermedius TaxID=1338 RepID=UPI00029C052D|nr:DUF6773 family protein [Streptococcus intermedius]EKU16822.1 putative membrane protein [Streptococcus intermedius BA1]
MKFIKRQILDEREVQLINKAGTEAFSLLMISNFIFYIGSVFVHSGEIYAQLFLFSSMIAFLYFLERCRRLGANYFNSFTFTIWGVIAMTAFVTVMILVQNFQVNHAMYQNNLFHAKLLLTIPITFLLYLPIMLVFNLLLEIIGKWQKARFEKYLSELED